MTDERQDPIARALREAYQAPDPGVVEAAWDAVNRMATTRRHPVRLMWWALAASLLLGAGFGTGWIARARIPQTPDPASVILPDGRHMPVGTPTLQLEPPAVETP